MSDQATKSILLVDDDVRLCEMISDFLSNHGFIISVCHNGEEAIERIDRDAPDLVVLDLMLPGVDGLSVCREVRGRYQGQILMLTALDDSVDEIAGLETGADDYMSKPVSPRLLLARVRTLFRRQPSGAVLSDEVQEVEVISIDDLVVDKSNREVRLRSETVRMTSTEFDLLWILVSNAGQALSRDWLHEKMYRLDLTPSDRRIDLLVSRLRKKLGDDTNEPFYLKTVRGQGYLMGKGR